MSAVTTFENYRSHSSTKLYEWRENAGFVTMLTASLFFALLTALAAQLRLFIPFTPVPFTGQVLVVLLAGFVLGRYGMVSMGMYLGLGATFGWFSGMTGLSALTGITAGYLFGFVLAAGLIGEMVHRKKDWSYAQILMIMTIGLGAIYIPGTLWLSAYLGIDLTTALLIGVLPFVLVDAMKVALASSIAYTLTPSKA